MIDETIPTGVYKLDEKAIIPFRGSNYSACYDLCACFHEETVKIHGTIDPRSVYNYGTDRASIHLYPDELALIPTGIIFALIPTHHMKIYSRSGNVWKKKLIVANQPGVIDSDYTKECFVLLHNQSNSPYTISTGDAVAQCEICINNGIQFGEVDKEKLNEIIKAISEVSTRDGGFGSTNKR